MSLERKNWRNSLFCPWCNNFLCETGEVRYDKMDTSMKRIDKKCHHRGNFFFWPTFILFTCLMFFFFGFSLSSLRVISEKKVESIFFNLFKPRFLFVFMVWCIKNRKKNADCSDVHWMKINLLRKPFENTININFGNWPHSQSEGERLPLSKCKLLFLVVTV